VLGDKAYSSAAIRAHLRRRTIRATIPEPADQVKNRLRRGSKGGRPPAFDAAAYKQRNQVSDLASGRRGQAQHAVRLMVQAGDALQQQVAQSLREPRALLAR
jgi:hypothetical protein